MFLFMLKKKIFLFAQLNIDFWQEDFSPYINVWNLKTKLLITVWEVH